MDGFVLFLYRSLQKEWQCCTFIILNLVEKEFRYLLVIL